MLIYEGTKDNFLTSVEQDTIAVEIEHNIYERMHRRTAKNEFRAWENSMEYMYKVLNDRDIPSDAGIAIEYNIPQTSKRVDFLISGYGKREDANVVLIELKQWDELEAVPGRDGLVQTYTGNAVRQVVHPSYQAWSYATLIKDYNASVQEGSITIYPCAYLHNYRRSEQDPIDAEQYEIYLEDAPAFTRGEVIKLRDFIKKSIRIGDHKELIYQIDSGRIRPSKSLQDSIAKMLKGNREFIMLDEQKVIYEEARTPGAFFQSLVTEINENVTDDKKVWFKTIGNTNFPSGLTEYKSDRQIMTEGSASDANIPAAITSGDYDFAVSFSPTATTILSKGWKTVARTSTHLSTENIVPSTWAVNTDFLAAHTEEFKAFVRGLLQGMQFRHEDPTQVAKYIEKDVNYTTPWESIDMDNAAWPTIADQKEWCATGGMAYTYVENIRNNHLNNPDNKDKIVKTAAEACDFTYVLEAATALAA